MLTTEIKAPALTRQRLFYFALISLASDLGWIIAGCAIWKYIPWFSASLSPGILAFLPVLGAGLFIGSCITAISEITSGRTYCSGSLKAARFIKGALTGNMPADTRVHHLLILPVKIFFTPLMLQFATGNFMALESKLSQEALRYPGDYNLFLWFNHILYPLLVTACFFIDTVFYLAGYLIYSKELNNTVRSVDSTVSGWTTALACYPPFIILTTTVMPAYYSDNIAGLNPMITSALYLLMIFLLIIYTAATVNLGWKCSNLTNRGIVTHGVYSLVRHPAYVAKNLFWWISVIPLAADAPHILLFMAGWSLLYFLRAVTEERHLRHDPDYIAYCSKVKYRFIPKLF